MASSNSLDHRFLYSPVVAVDKDKHSHFAVKWAIENLLVNDPTLILIHVKIKSHNNSNGDADLQSVFTPFRALGARRLITMREIILEDTDVSKALLEYINHNDVTNIVLGASTWNPLVRKFLSHDVPTMINKAAPESCSVIVISKGKTQSVRPAVRSFTSSPAPPKSTPPPEQSPSRGYHSEPVGGSRQQSMKGEPNTMMGHDRMKPKKGPDNPSRNSIDNSASAPRISLSSNSLSIEGDFSSPLNSGLVDAMANDMDFTNIMEAANDGNSSSKEVEAEMNRLKSELKQTMDMYNTACKEAVSANQKAKELHKWKLEEARRFEQARLAEEAALKLAELEKAKCKVAIEAAEKAQKLAEMEAQRRRFAEQKAKREAEEKNRALNVLSNNDVRYRKYSIEEIEAATNNFSDSLKLGEGGYGPVYGGRLDHTPVAIKVLRSDAAQGKKQFQQEVEVLSCIRHPNMVLLLGACPEYGCLVYEHMNNGSLEDRLYRKSNTPPIPWGIRFKLAAEIATGLLFLHQAKPEPLVHRDLKPANILLDRNYVCKISDVGLARLVPPSVADRVTEYHMTSAAGTFCYIDPEYQQTGRLGTKSDIYSLGIMLLQMITARPPMGLTYHVERAIEKGKFAEFLDPTVPNWPIEEALRFAKLALKCAELRKKDRPDLGSVILPELNRLKMLGLNSLSNNGSPDNL